MNGFKSNYTPNLIHGTSLTYLGISQLRRLTIKWEKVLWQALLYGNESRDHHVKYDIPHKGTNQYYAAMQILVSPYLEVRRYNENLNYFTK